jgi:hypothetical protein
MQRKQRYVRRIAAFGHVLTPLQLTLEIHICVLWGLVSQDSLPTAVSNINRTNYDTCFDNAKAIKASVTTALENHARDITKARDLVTVLLEKVKTKQGSIINNIKQIPEPHLLMMFRTVATCGLPQWNPDVLSGDPDSMYNVLHETIALITFEQAAAAYAYSFTGMVMNFVNNYALLKRLYWNFIFSYMMNIAKVENKNPGQFNGTLLKGPVWKRRHDVRTFFFFENCTPSSSISYSLVAGDSMLSSRKASVIWSSDWPKKLMHIPTMKWSRLTTKLFIISCAKTVVQPK